MIGYLASSSSDAEPIEIVGDSNPQTLCTPGRHLILALHLLVKPALRGTPHFFIVETWKVAENARCQAASLTPGSQVDRATR